MSRFQEGQTYWVRVKSNKHPGATRMWEFIGEYLGYCSLNAHAHDGESHNHIDETEQHLFRELYTKSYQETKWDEVEDSWVNKFITVSNFRIDDSKRVNVTKDHYDGGLPRGVFYL